MFDAFYCCFMIGLDTRRVGQQGDLKADVFVNGYPDDYKPQADVIAGLLIDAELERKEIRMGDSASIEREMVKLINPTSAARLDDEGNTLLSLYAASGFKLLQDHMMSPASIDDFLVSFHGHWHQGAEASKAVGAVRRRWSDPGGCATRTGSSRCRPGPVPGALHSTDGDRRDWPG